MPKVIDFTGVTTLDLDPDRVLTKCIGGMNSAVVIGRDKNGDFYFASSLANGGDMLWLLNLAEKKLLESEDPE